MASGLRVRLRSFGYTNLLFHSSFAFVLALSPPLGVRMMRKCENNLQGCTPLFVYDRQRPALHYPSLLPFFAQGRRRSRSRQT